MPALPPDLFATIVHLCEPYFRLPGDRDASLIIPLSTWEGFSSIDWQGNPRAFATRLIYQLPGPQLKAVLKALTVGSQAEAEIVAICDQIDAALGLTNKPIRSPVIRYYQDLVTLLSSPRYQLDSRFVKLTLLLDQGLDAQGVRFVPDGQRGRFDSLLTLLATTGERTLVLLGQPGSGKTTLLRRLQLERAWSELETATGVFAFFLPLNAFRGNDLGAPIPSPYHWLAREWEIRGHDLPDFAALFQQGRLLLLLDGLNELPHRDKTDFQERVAEWQAFLAQYQHYGNTVIFSCRSLDYSTPLGSESAPVRQVQVEPLTPAQIESFLTLYLKEQALPVWDVLQRDIRQMALFNTPFFLRLLVDQVAATREMPDGKTALMTGFVRRALHREIEQHHQRLLVTGNLLSENDRQQIIRNIWATSFDLPGEGPLIPHLARLAYQMQSGRVTQEAGQVRLSQDSVQALLSHPQADEMIAAGIQLNVLDKDITRREIIFFHQLLQEYFAARVVAGKPEPERLTVPWHQDKVTPSLADTLAVLEVSDPLPALATTGWEETTVLAVAMTGDSERFIRDLMVTNLPLAARCASAPEIKVAPALVTQLQKALLERISNAEADLRARISAAEALGELGDPRFVRRVGPHGAYLLPPLVSIPAGYYPLGDDDSGYKSEGPSHTVEIVAFAIGMFPVTNAEYRLFIEAGGYKDERWWETEAARAWLRGEGSSAGAKQHGRDLQKYVQGFSDDVIRQQNVAPTQIEFWLWLKNASDEERDKQYEKWYPTGKIYHQPAYWDDSQFNQVSRPVVGVTWFEARAYCGWLSAQTGNRYTLPAEVEWEAAARGKVGRNYAYGQNFDPAHCNTFETHIRRTTPVGVFPGGQTIDGVADLSGNVWEWTTTIWGTDVQKPSFTYPYHADDGREDLVDGTSRRVLRGGSWDDNQSAARAAYRSYNHPNFRYYYVGFRVGCRPPSHDL